MKMVKVSTELQLLLCDKHSLSQIVDLATHMKQLKTVCVGGDEKDRAEMENALQLINIGGGSKWTLQPYCEHESFEFNCYFVD